MPHFETDSDRRQWLLALGGLPFSDQTLAEEFARSEVSLTFQYQADEPAHGLTRFYVGRFTFYDSCREFDPQDVPGQVLPLGGGHLADRPFGVVFLHHDDGALYWEQQDAGEDPPRFERSSSQVVRIAESFTDFFDRLALVGGEELTPVKGQERLFERIQTLPMTASTWGMSRTIAASDTALTFGEGPTRVYGRVNGRWAKLFEEPEFEAGAPRELHRVDYDGRILALGQESSTSSYKVAFLERADDEFEVKSIDGRFSGKVALVDGLCVTARKTDSYAYFLSVLKLEDDAWSEIYRADVEAKELVPTPRKKPRKSCSKKPDCTCKKCIEARDCTKDNACLCEDCCHRYEFAADPLLPENVGHAVATDGQWIIVGCDNLASLVFRYAKGTIRFHSRIDAAPPLVKQRSFRGPVEHALFDEGRLILAAPTENSASPKPGSKGSKARSGAVFVFELKRGKWTQVQVIQEPTIRKEARFGQACSARNGWMVVTTNDSVYKSDEPLFFGRAYLYQWSGGAYQLRAQVPMDAHRFAGAAMGDDFLAICLGSNSISFVELGGMTS